MVLTSKGAAGITGAGLVTLTASLQAFGGTFFTAESIAVGIALVVGIDRIMSEGRALTNCIGNGVGTMVIAKLQGERDDERFMAVLDDPSLADPDQVEDEPEVEPDGTSGESGAASSTRGTGARSGLRRRALGARARPMRRARAGAGRSTDSAREPVHARLTLPGVWPLSPA